MDPIQNYYRKVQIDFVDLPQYIIENVIYFFDYDGWLTKDEDFIKWSQQLKKFLQTIPDNYIDSFLQKGIELASKADQYHSEKECQERGRCLLSEGWQRRKAIAENLLREILPPPMKEKKAGPKMKPAFVPKPFVELLINPNQIGDCLNLLKEAEQPCISDANKYLKNKGCIIVWFNAMERKGMFNYTFKNDAERQATLNYNFSNLNISESLFRQAHKRATDTYKKHFENEIAAIKG
jgi:hypothetical protein